MRQREEQRGFTLPEILIAMSILAGLSAALAPLIYSVSRLQTQIVLDQSEKERTYTAAAALERLGVRILSPAQTGRGGPAFPIMVPREAAGRQDGGRNGRAHLSPASSVSI